MTDCVLKQYCLSGEKRGECRKCHEYLKFERKKSKSRVAIGRSNKQRGKKSEKKLLLHLQRRNLDARIVEGSGCLKKIKADADADLRVVINGVERKIENKKRISFERIRNLIGETKILYITNFCYIMDENIFYEIVRGGVIGKKGVTSVLGNIFPIREVSDRNFGELHKFFNQDNADIVTLDESYKDFLFCLQPTLFDEITIGATK